MSLSEERRLRLAHDVGKYIVRAALNLPKAGAVPDELVHMLVADLYGDDRHRPALETFDSLVPDPSGPTLIRAREHLLRIAQRELDVRSGDVTAVRQVAAEALLVAELLGTS